MKTEPEARGCGFILLMGGLAVPATAVAVWLVFFTLEFVFDVDVSLDWAFGTIMFSSVSAGLAVVAWLLRRQRSRATIDRAGRR